MTERAPAPVYRSFALPEHEDEALKAFARARSVPVASVLRSLVGILLRCEEQKGKRP